MKRKAIMNRDGHSPACDDHRCVLECQAHPADRKGEVSNTIEWAPNVVTAEGTQGAWIILPIGYDAAKVDAEDVAHDPALRLLNVDEVEALHEFDAAVAGNLASVVSRMRGER